MRPIALLIWVIIIAPLVWCLYREHTEDDQEPKPRLAIPILELGRWVIEYIENAASDSDTSQHLPAAVFQLPGIHIKFTYIAPPGRGIFDRFLEKYLYAAVYIIGSVKPRVVEGNDISIPMRIVRLVDKLRKRLPVLLVGRSHAVEISGRQLVFVVSGSNPNTAEQADDRHDIRCNDLYPFKHISSSREHKK